jgi:hypothetical protein
VVRDKENETNRSSSRIDGEPEPVKGRSSTMKISKTKTSHHNVVARNPEGYDVYINLFDYIKEEMKITS